MNTTEKQFIDLLSNSIRNEVCKKKYDNVDWNELMNLEVKLCNTFLSNNICDVYTF